MSKARYQTYGSFDDNAREYVITRPDTPRPWSNYLGSTEYGAIITNNAGGYSFYRSAMGNRFLRLRPNSVPMDQPGRYFYIRDNDNGDYWSSSWQPVGKKLSKYSSTCRHGTAYTVITSLYDDIGTETTYFVPLGQAFEYWRLRLRNTGGKKRRLSIFTYCEFASSWNMGNDLMNLQYSQFIIKSEVKGNMLGQASHPYTGFDPDKKVGLDRLWMSVVGAPVAGFDTVRERFLGGIYRTYANPEAVECGDCSNSLSEGDNGCGTFKLDVTLAPGQTRELIVLLGIGTPNSHGYRTVRKYGNSRRCELELQKLKNHWHSQIAAVSIATPDPDFDHMVNVWNSYNSLITYSWSRHASLIYNGERDGLGFRDTVQDFLGAMPLLKNGIRDRLELMLTGQLSNGGAIPVIKPWDHRPGEMKAPHIEEYRSDDCLWFFNAVPDFVAETGDIGFYRKVLPYADKGKATVLAHLRRALEFNIERSGKNGLPCGLAADWNDCVKMGYNGESVMVAFQLRYGLDVYAKIADRLKIPAESAWARKNLRKIDSAIQKTAWDGRWFLWAIGADGHRYGSRLEKEGQIYINTQVWAVISGAASAVQGRSSMDALKKKLATPYGIMLSAPPFTKTPPTVMGGVIYNHGIKENAGIFCHTQGWAVISECILGNGDQAYEYYRAFMPSAYNERADLREIEPYAHCQTTYAPCNRNGGKSRVPWLSGTASWACHSAIQWILGIRPELEGLRIDPCIPKSWQGFTITRNFRGKDIHITIENPDGRCRGVRELLVEGKTIKGNIIPLSLLKNGMKVKAVIG